MKLYPKCLEEDAEFGNTSKGYILPCCWWDQPFIFDDDSPIKDLLKEKFKLSEVNSVQEIVESVEWKSFFDRLREGKAPNYCYNICGKPGKMFGIK